MLFFKEKKIIGLYSFITLLIFVFIVSCGKTAPGYFTKEDLTKNTIELINKGDAKALMKLVIQKDEFIKKYYPHLPEARQKATLSGEDFYRIFIGLQRKAAVISKIKSYEGKIISVQSIGEPDKIIETDNFRLLKKIPITLSVKDKTGQIIDITDNQILGAVIEEKNKYKLLNIFR